MAYTYALYPTSDPKMTRYTIADTPRVLQWTVRFPDASAIGIIERPAANCCTPPATTGWGFPALRAVYHQGPENDQVHHRRYPARTPVDGQIPRRQRHRNHRETRRQLLHSAGDHRVRLPRLAPLDDRPEAPPRHSKT